MTSLISRGALVLVAGLCAAGCVKNITDKERNLSDIHYDLGIEAQNKGSMQEAYAEFEESLKLNPENSRAHNALGVLLHVGFKRPAEAISHFEQALVLDPGFSEARVNLGNVHSDQKEYDKAVALYEQALNDMRYATPHIAQGNLGMAEYRRGNVEKAVDHIRSALTVKPEFCQGYRNLGTIYEETGKTEDACSQFKLYREACPEIPDAYYREGVCLAKLGNVSEARDRFAQCEAKSSTGQLKEDCRRLGEQLQ